MDRILSPSSLFGDVIDALVIGAIVLNANEHVVVWNRWMEEASGWSRESVLGRPFTDVFPELADHRVHQAVRDALLYGHPALVSQSLHRSPFPLQRGQHQRIEQSVQVTALRSGGALYCMIQIQDVTIALERERVLRRQTVELREAHQRQLALLNGIVEMAWLKDAAGRYLAVNQTYAEVFGLSPEQLVGRTDFDLHPQELAARYAEEDREVMQAASIKRTEELRHTTEGEERWAERVNVPVIGPTGKVIGTAGTARDVTERKLAERRTYYLAHHDNLTGLANRVLLADRIELSIASSKRNRRLVAVMFVDLDRFKIINDSLGHDVGDDLLRLVAQRLRDSARSVDTVARLGGDEFVVVLHDVHDTAEVARIARKLCSHLGEPYELRGQILTVTPSIGISLFPQDGQVMDDLLKSADNAMYRAKQKGRNGFEFFSPDMTAGAKERMVLEQALRSALDRNEFLLHFQPLVNVRSGQICSAEVQIRWNHPTLGMVPPLKFIPIAEDSGLIVPIGEWVLRTACEQNRKWQSEGLPQITLAVNLSALQFRQHGLVDLVSDVLAESQLAPEYLELELTESMMMENAGTATDTLQALKDMGLKLSIDDFGTGYSSLGYLKRFPIDKLKIDQTFVRDVTVDSDDAAIVTAIIALGKSMQLKVVAEGVETVEQFRFLKSRQCDEIQGFFHSRPMPADEFARLFAKAH